MSMQVKDGNGQAVTLGDSDFGGVKALWHFVRGIQAPQVVINFTVTAPGDSSVTAFPSHSPDGDLIIQASLSNSTVVRIGGLSTAAADGIELAPGEVLRGVRIDDTAKWALAVGAGGSGDKLNVLGG